MMKSRGLFFRPALVLRREGDRVDPPYRLGEQKRDRVSAPGAVMAALTIHSMFRLAILAFSRRYEREVSHMRKIILALATAGALAGTAPSVLAHDYDDDVYGHRYYRGDYYRD